MHSTKEMNEVLEIAKGIFYKRIDLQPNDCQIDFNYAIKAICKHFGVRYRPELMCKGSIEKSITNLGFRVRTVELSRNWPTNQFDALLVRSKVNGSVIPVLRYSPTKITYYNSLEKKWCFDTTSLMDTLDFQAIEISKGFAEEAKGFNQIIVFAFKHIWKRELLLLSGLLFLNFLVGLGIPFSMKLIFDHVILQGEKIAIFHVVTLLTAYFLSVTCFGLTSSLLELRMELRIYDHFQTAIWSKILSLRAIFYKSMSTGDILQRLWYLEELRAVFSGIAAQTIIAIAFSPFYLIILFIMNWTLALVSIGFIICAFIVTSVIAIGVYKIRSIVANAESTTNSWVLDILNSIRKIKISATELVMLKKWAEVFARKRKLKLRMQNLSNFHSSFIVFIEGIALLVLFYIAFRGMIFSGQVGTMLAFLALYGSFSALLFGFTKTMLKIASIVPFFNRVSPIIHGVLETKKTDQIHYTQLSEIRFSNISFGYPGRDTNVLNNVSLHIKKNQIVGLTGPSGSAGTGLILQ